MTPQPNQPNLPPPSRDMRTYKSLRDLVQGVILDSQIPLTRQDFLSDAITYPQLPFDRFHQTDHPAEKTPVSDQALCGLAFEVAPMRVTTDIRSDALLSVCGTKFHFCGTNLALSCGQANALGVMGSARCEATYKRALETLGRG